MCASTQQLQPWRAASVRFQPVTAAQCTQPARGPTQRQFGHRPVRDSFDKACACACLKVYLFNCSAAVYRLQCALGAPGQGAWTKVPP